MRPRTGLLVSFALFPLLATASTANAQAWVSDKGELSLSLRSDYQYASGIFLGKYGLTTGLTTSFVNSALSVEYVPIEKLSTALTINANGASYTGPTSLPTATNFALAHGGQDDGSRHWNVTDLEFNAHYQAYDGPVTVTPGLRLRTPVTDYENQGYAAAGTHLKEAGLGFALGKYGLGVEDLIFQAGYMFTVTSKEDRGGADSLQYRPIRSDVDLSFAYIFSQKFAAAAGASLRITHDGFQIDQYHDLTVNDPMNGLIAWHDPVLKQWYLAPSALASYQVSDAVSLTGNFAIIVVGNNVSNAMTFGLTASFSTNLGGGTSVADASADLSGDASATTTTE